MLEDLGFPELKKMPLGLMSEIEEVLELQWNDMQQILQEQKSGMAFCKRRHQFVPLMERWFLSIQLGGYFERNNRKKR